MKQNGIIIGNTYWCIPQIYSSGAWKVTQPKIYSSNTWQDIGGRLRMLIYFLDKNGSYFLVQDGGYFLVPEN